jgi:hypothetical protein
MRNHSHYDNMTHPWSYDPVTGSFYRYWQSLSTGQWFMEYRR